VSAKGEKYKSMKMMKMHEGKEGKKEMMMEYGKVKKKPGVKKPSIKKKK
jgi:hypothetical protein